jgi:hypothetical protein
LRHFDDLTTTPTNREARSVAMCYSNLPHAPVLQRRVATAALSRVATQGVATSRCNSSTLASCNTRRCNVALQQQHSRELQHKALQRRVATAALSRVATQGVELQHQPRPKSDARRRAEAEAEAAPGCSHAPRQARRAAVPSTGCAAGNRARRATGLRGATRSSAARFGPVPLFPSPSVRRAQGGSQCARLRPTGRGRAVAWQH